MDDILMFFVESPEWDSEAFCKDFEESTCYVPPLELEAGRQDVFLETSLEIKEGRLRYWLKNDNCGKHNKIWRYQHFGSHMPYIQKRAVLTACLKKVHEMACDKAALFQSAINKLQEFKRLSYPRHMLRAACTYIGASRGEATWLDVRDSLDSLY